MRAAYAVVVPTIGRPSLGVLLESLAAQRFDDARPAPVEVVVCDDRPLDGAPEALVLPDLPALTARGVPVRVVRSGGRGPAAARNAGWRSVRAEWVVLLDDDVVLPGDWSERLAADLAATGPDVAGTQARLRVPLPAHRRPTDWERNTAGLEGARWATADMAYRREVLEGLAGFDERFPRAYREDADLALRARRAGWRLVRGSRTTEHPVRPADPRVSVRVQAGARDDALMRALHGPRWREAAETGRGRFAWHVATVGAGVGALGAAVLGRRGVAAAAGAAWAALTADFVRRRVAPGPGPGEDGWVAEWRTMAWTSAVIPPVAVRHRVAGLLRHRGGAPAWPPPVRAVLFDRDGTLVHDVPYNGDPDRVRVVDDARAVLDDLRARGIQVGVVTNQSGIGRGIVTLAQVEAVEARVEAELGPFDVWVRCPHAPEDACTCRKPQPGLVLRAAAQLGLSPAECVVIGDIGADVGAAVAAGAGAVLVPTPVTRPEEVAAAPQVAVSLTEAVALVRERLAGGSPAAPTEVAEVTGAVPVPGEHGPAARPAPLSTVGGGAR
ncbi:HAD-IIIA family hydrolase [Cellulomonas cellasea]|uniref:D,D-heptose 1,7-bisphosphate phosphatase n=2 Tax=Cellulomonas cellasea TaxID=43670 RepID=A0A4Y3L154_9CELL|nr:HAD-IIIA family hydrolase [Cellulomonas cellasea]GEA88698.1 haloacid dehalogenase [Cellulomonas cellasea]